MDVVFKAARVWLLLVLAAAACSKRAPVASDGGPWDEFDRTSFLRNVAETIVIPTYQEFAAATEALETSVTAYCAGLGTADEQPRRQLAQQGWQAAMDVWQRAEMLLIGPAAASDQTVRSRIYSWPVVSTCAVDQDVMLRHGDPAAYDIALRLDNRRGLDGLERVLFAPDLEHTCPVQSAPAGWDALPEADRVAARCGYAGVAAADVAGQAAALLDAWLPGGGDYAGILADAGASGSPFTSAHDAVNEISDALFYLDIATKDLKLAVPAGIEPSQCGAVGTPCPRDVELPTSRRSKEAIRHNLLAFQRVFLGNEPGGDAAVGFDDFLYTVGAGDLRARMEANTSAALAAVDAVPGTLSQALTDDLASVLALHAAVKAITDDLKGEFLTLLRLMIPAEGAGDSD